MRAVIDTNILLSGLLWHDAPDMLIEHVRDGTLSLISSPALLADVINRPKFQAIVTGLVDRAAVLLDHLAQDIKFFEDQEARS